MNVDSLVEQNYKGARLVFASNRMDTFVRWSLNDKDSPTRAEKMAEAGFINTSTDEGPSGVCVFCNKELCFDAGDDPWAEHVKRGDQCEFVKLNKLDETTWTVKDYLLLLGAAHINQEMIEAQRMINLILDGGKEVKSMISNVAARE